MTDRRSLSLSSTHSRSLSLSYTHHTHTHSLSLSLTHTHTTLHLGGGGLVFGVEAVDQVEKFRHWQPLSLSLSLSLANSLTHSLTLSLALSLQLSLSLSHTHTHTLSLSLSPSPPGRRRPLVRRRDGRPDSGEEVQETRFRNSVTGSRPTVWFGIWESEKEREKRLHSPFALHKPIQWAI